MTGIIKEQLDLLQIKNPEYDGEKFIFRKNCGAKSSNSKQNNETLILIADYFLNPEFDFHKTINKGIHPPTSNKLYVTIIKSTDKSVYVIGHYKDEEWSGWIPKKSFQIISEEA